MALFSNDAAALPALAEEPTGTTAVFYRVSRVRELLAEIAAARDLRPLVSDILPLGEAQRAIDRMMHGENNGKILIRTR